MTTDDPRRSSAVRARALSALAAKVNLPHLAPPWHVGQRLSWTEVISGCDSEDSLRCDAREINCLTTLESSCSTHTSSRWAETKGGEARGMIGRRPRAPGRTARLGAMSHEPGRARSQNVCVTRPPTSPFPTTCHASPRPSTPSVSRARHNAATEPGCACLSICLRLQHGQATAPPQRPELDGLPELCRPCDYRLSTGLP